MSAVSSLTERTARGARWRFASALVGGATQFGISVLLARLLTPADVGLVGLAIVFVGLVQRVGDLGIGSAVVQHRDLTDRQIRSAFTFSLALGVAMALVLLLVAPAGGALMRDERVTPMLRLFSMLLIFQGPAVVAAALLRRDLDFRSQFFIDVGSYAVGYGVVMTALAIGGYGAWSLVWGAIVQAVLASAAQVATVRHPLRPLFAPRELRGILHFGLGAAGIGWINFVATNGDNFVVGRWMGPASLALYIWAYTLAALPHAYAATIMSSALFPAFAQVQAEPARLRRGYLTLTRLIAMIAGPAMAATAVGARHFVRVLYGEAWEGVVVPLEILCVAGYFRALYHPGGILAQGVGRVYGELWRQIVYAGLVIGGALIGSRFGLPAVAAAVGVAILFMFVATGRFALRTTDTSWQTYVIAQRGALIATAVTWAVALTVRLLLEARHASSTTITIAIGLAVAIPWGFGLITTLADPDLEPLRSGMPRWCRRLVELRRPRAL